MNRFENILVASKADYDDDATLREALELAIANGAKLTVLQVSPELSDHGPASTIPTDVRQQLIEDVRSEIEARVQTLAGGRDVNLVARVQTGTPSVEIVRSVIRDGHDLLVLTSQRKEGLRDRLFGSTIARLMRKCPCPVWVRKANVDPPEQILVTVDTLASSPTQDEVNQMVLELGASIAREEDADLIIAHCWLLRAEMLYRNKGRIPSDKVDEMVTERRDAAADAFNEFVARFDLSGIKASKKLIKGEPGDVIPVLAKREGIDLIIMGSVARTGIAGFLIGNTAERILQDVDCSVLAVKPSGFETPVELDD